MNLGAQKLRAATDATIAELAELLGIERTYCGRILSGDRTPGLGLRRTIRGLYGVEYDDWEKSVPASDKAPDPKKSRKNHQPTRAES